MSRTVSRSAPGAGAPSGAARAVCHRHPRHVWIASCPDCTTWHLAGLRARRDQHPAVPATTSVA